jgi:hypothetical protein
MFLEILSIPTFTGSKWDIKRIIKRWIHMRVPNFNSNWIWNELKFLRGRTSKWPSSN